MRIDYDNIPFLNLTSILNQSNFLPQNLSPTNSRLRLPQETKTDLLPNPTPQAKIKINNQYQYVNFGRPEYHHISYLLLSHFSLTLARHPAGLIFAWTLTPLLP